METGTIKFFNNAKGFGFITPDNSKQDIFVHVTGLVDKVQDSDKVTYEVTEGKRGVSAVNVRIV